MAEISVPPTVLLAPLLIIGALAGLRRGLARETVTGLSLAVVLLAFDGLVRLSYGVVRVLSQVASELAATAGVRAPEIGGLVPSRPSTLVLVLCTVLFLFGAYWLGSVLGSGGGGSRWRSLTGAMLGALNVLLVLAILSVRAQDILGRARMRQLFLVPGSRRGLDVQVSPFPPSAALAQWGAYAVIVLVLIALVWGVTRLPRLKG